MSNCIELYTDGACSGNPGPGGYGIVLKYKNARKEISKGFKYTTNNRMELLAVIDGLKAIKDKTILVKIYSDSKYVVDAIEKKWLNNWVNKRFNKVANSDLWLQFLKEYNPTLHQFIWVKGHASNIENNRCDGLAVAAYKTSVLEIDKGYEKKTNEFF
ncbi:MAG: ribonuclease HI [Bacteroidetes bacterium]|nr:ribonuclease HI [Bacteroidota bacterium]